MVFGRKPFQIKKKITKKTRTLLQKKSKKSQPLSFPILGIQSLIKSFHFTMFHTPRVMVRAGHTDTEEE